MLKTIQIKLIHVLGGYTKEEYEKYSSDRLKLGYYEGHEKGYDIGYKQGYNVGVHNGGNIIITRLMKTANNNYGCDKQTWIDAIYSDIENISKHYAK